MMRATFDKLISWTGLLLAVLLIVAGGLLTWASTFIDHQVTGQLGAQHVTMPTSQTGLSDLPAADRAALQQYSGQQLTTGSQAKAYADHFIAVHLNGIGAGKTYSEVSGQYIALCSDPKAATTQACTDLAQTRQTMFMGETLRGLLLYGYAFATIGTIAGIAAISAFAGAALMLLLVGIGFWHSRRSATAVTAGARPVGAQA